MQNARVNDAPKSSHQIFYTNINSLRNKVDLLEGEIQQFRPVAICIVETHLDAEIASGEISINEYSIFRKDRNMFGGGVAVYVRKDISAINIPLVSSAEALLVKLVVAHHVYFIATVYRPPGSCDPDLLPDLFCELETQVDLTTNNLLVCGDFNLPTIVA